MTKKKVRKIRSDPATVERLLADHMVREFWRTTQDDGPYGKRRRYVAGEGSGSLTRPWPGGLPGLGKKS